MRKVNECNNNRKTIQKRPPNEAEVFWAALAVLHFLGGKVTMGKALRSPG